LLSSSSSRSSSSYSGGSSSLKSPLSSLKSSSESPSPLEDSLPPTPEPRRCLLAWRAFLEYYFRFSSFSSSRKFSISYSNINNYIISRLSTQGAAMLRTFFHAAY
jgi:hypothetical protein